MKVHGLTDEFLADKPLFAAVADELLEYVAGAEIMIHNAAFDVGFLDAELDAPRATGRSRSSWRKVTDSLSMAREMFPGKSNSLDALCRRLEVDNSNRTLHGALLDAGLLAEVYIRMTRGQDSLVIDGRRTTAWPARSRRCAAIDLSRVQAAGARGQRGRSRRARRACWPTSTRPAAAGRSGGPLWHNRGFPAPWRADPSRAGRAVSSAVEHCLHTAGVAGSNPAPPTRYTRAIPQPATKGPPFSC